jgi:hypothetical protein
MKTKPFCWTAIFVIWAVAAACALWAPLDVVDKYPLLNWYVGVKHELLSLMGLQKFVGYPKSDFPQVSELYFSIAYLAIPFIFMLLWIWLRKSVGVARGGLLVKKELSALDRVGITLITLIFLLVTLGIFIYQGGDPRKYILLGTSRYQLAYLGMVMPLGFSGALTISIFGFSRIFEIKRRK